MESLSRKISSIKKLVNDLEWEKAEHELKRELQKNPNDPQFNSLLGQLYNNLGQPEKALEFHQKVIECLPEESVAYFNLALSLKEIGIHNSVSVIENLKKALDLEPDNVVALKFLGIFYISLGKYDLAEQLLLQALNIKDDGNSHVDISKLYIHKGLFSKAMVHLKKAITLQPDNVQAHNNVANILIRSCLHPEGQETYRNALLLDSNYLGLYHNYLFDLHYDDKITVEELYKEHMNWAERCSNDITARGSFKNLRIKDKRLRVGYVSGDLRGHSVGFFMKPILASHSEREIETFVYYNYETVDNVTLAFHKMLPVGWRDIHHLSDERVIDQIQGDRIDILVDLSGHSKGNRMEVFAAKPAPIQVTYLGYPDTTGLDSMDYRFTDQLSDPAGLTDEYYSEKLIRLEDCFLCYQPPDNLPDISGNKEPVSGKIVFCSFNNSAKINSTTIRLWSKLLKEIPGASLQLKASAFADSEIVDNVSSMFTKQGVQREQLKFNGFVDSVADHLALYNSTDIALDTFPYNGTTTTFEALLMGCPVVTLVGDRHSSRVGLTILSNLGLQECIAYSEEDYVRISINLATDPARLTKIKRNLRMKLQASVLVDGVGFVKKLEKAYRMMWHTWCEAEGDSKPARIKVKGGVRVTVPDSYQLLTPFILREQEDWFEIDLGFVKKFLQPGMQVIDIGANYGLYTLNMAKQVGEKGNILAFEPSSDTAAYLKMSVDDNKFDNIWVIEAGLSSEKGGAILSLKWNAELNSICHQGDDIAENSEFISLLSLDNAVEEFGLQKLDFIKLDAEGEEARILHGAGSTLNNFSPLIMYELTHGDGHNLGLVYQLKDYGYDSYYLVPGLNVLVPFDHTKKSDGYLLNLFACKNDMADKLEGKGLLCQKIEQECSEKITAKERELFWKGKKYFATVEAFWKTRSKEHSERERVDYLDSLDMYIQAHKSISPAARVGLLVSAFNSLKHICETSPSLPRLLSLVRVSGELGEREYAIGVLEVLYELFNSSDQLVIDEEHLAALERYDNIDPIGVVGEWCLSSVAEARIKYKYFSSYFDIAAESLETLELLKELGLQSPEMERRRQLLLLRDSKIKTVEHNNLLSLEGADNLNATWWNLRRSKKRNTSH